VTGGAWHSTRSGSTSTARSFSTRSTQQQQVQAVQMGEVAGVWGVLREEWLILAFNTHLRHRHRQSSVTPHG
jgi:hypothetical protein